MESGKRGIKLERFAVVPDRCLIVPMSLQFMRHELVHPGGVWTHQRQTKHGLACEVGMDPVGSVEHLYIGWIQVEKSADDCCCLAHIASSRVDLNQLHTSFYLNFLIL